MAAKVISFSIDASSISKAIRELQAYQKDFEEKVHELRRRIAETIRWNAEIGFSVAPPQDIFYGGTAEPNNVKVRVEERGNVSVVIADGPEAVFIEFGAGVYHNGAVGGSPHEWGAQNGFLIGTYGEGNGRKNVWALPKEMWTETNKNGKPKPILTRGTPASKPMFTGVRAACAAIERLTREVFG